VWVGYYCSKFTNPATFGSNPISGIATPNGSDLYGSCEFIVFPFATRSKTRSYSPKPQNRYASSIENHSQNERSIYLKTVNDGHVKVRQNTSMEHELHIDLTLKEAVTGAS